MTAPKILIAENEKLATLNIRETIEKLGYPVIDVVGSGKKAVQAASDHQPDLVLMDIVLEGALDGISAAGHLQRKNDIPVVFMTAYSDDETLERVKAVDPFGYLIKPFSERELKSIIEIALYKHQMQQEVQEHKRWLTTILRNIGEAVIATDAQNRIRFINPVAAKIAGCTRRQALGRDLDEILIVRNPKDQKALNFGRPSAQETGGAAYGHLLFHTAAGMDIPIECSTTVIRADNGRFNGWVIVFQDITARLHEEEDQRKMEAQLQVSQKMESLGVLAGGVAHDFNNLLTGILGNVGLAQLDLAPQSPLNETIEQIEKAAIRAAELCKQMLAYAGKSQLTIEPVSLNDVVREMGPLLRVSVSKKATINYSFRNDIPAIEADAAQIRQIIMNLANNAADAIPDSKGAIKIKTGLAVCDENDLRKNVLGEERQAGEYVYFEIEDTGTGMSPEIRERVFEPFFTTKFLGRGLGLAAVLGIVRGHGGMIGVTSEPGKGANIKVYFPGSKVLQSKKESDRQTFQEWRDSGSVLIVDDEEPALDVGQKILERIGYKTFTAENGLDAIEIFKQKKDEIKLVLLDLTMPLMDGNETFEALRKIRKDIKIILSSGYNEQDVTAKIDGDALSSFIHKPYLAEQMIMKIREVMTISV